MLLPAFVIYGSYFAEYDCVTRTEDHVHLRSVTPSRYHAGNKNGAPLPLYQQGRSAVPPPRISCNYVELHFIGPQAAAVPSSHSPVD